MSLEEFISDGQLCPEELCGVHSQVAALARELFDGAVSICKEADPEIDAEYYVVYAEADGEVEDLVELSHVWHRRLGDVARCSSLPYCLSLVLK